MPFHTRPVHYRTVNPRHTAFVAEYLKDGNAQRAATTAGYAPKSAHVTGARLLKNVAVAAELARAREAVTAKAIDISGLTVAWVLKALEDNYHRAMQAEPVMKFDHEAKEYRETGEYVYQGAVANRALELIGKHLGAFDRPLSLEDLDKCSREEIAMIAKGQMPPRLKLMA